ncbi:MAG: efflux RND transporter periplasmic adaptor subunit [Bacteroidetes bacterium]|nr:efflux RND transporter periplasmic adaptor subunit [Bacteroidota bacterium]
MNSKRYITVIAILFAIVGLSACKQKKPEPIRLVQNKAYYTCSMHPQVHEDHSGNCPVCSMKLIKVELTGGNSGMAAHTIKLTAAQIQLAGILLDTVGTAYTSGKKDLTGTVTADENKSEELSSRAAGRVQQLFVRVIGDRITKGQPVYTIYSEDLLEAEKEYLLALQQQKQLHNPDVDYTQFISAARQKLILWGMTNTQIGSLAASGKTSATITINSTINGTVSDIAVHEGDYIVEGSTILKTQNLGSLWVEAQIYASEANEYRVGNAVDVSLPAVGRTLPGKIEFMNPELSDDSKVELLRVSISNQNNLIQPGMMAYVSISSGKNRTLAIPTSAIIYERGMSKVWVKNADGSFSPKFIQIAAGNSSFVPVMSGLNSGDILVSGGAYLLNSEDIFKNGGDKSSMAGMKM